MARDSRRRAGQLPLPLDAGGSRGRLPARLRAMIPSPGTGPFDDPEHFFEPWWPGTRAFAFVDGGVLRLQVDHLADPLATFPELRVLSDQLAGDGVVLEGTLLALDQEGRPDGDLLRRRLAGESAAGGTGALVAADLLWVEGRDLTDRPFRERRARLLTLLRDGDRCVVSRGLHAEGVTLGVAAASMGLDAISARQLSGRWRPGDAGQLWLKLPVPGQPITERRPLLVLLQRLPLDS